MTSQLGLGFRKRLLLNRVQISKDGRTLVAHLSQGSKRRPKGGMRLRLGSDPLREFGDRGGSRVSPIAQDDGRIVPTVTDRSSFKKIKK